MYGLARLQTAHEHSFEKGLFDGVTYELFGATRSLLRNGFANSSLLLRVNFQTHAVGPSSPEYDLCRGVRTSLEENLHYHVRLIGTPERVYTGVFARCHSGQMLSPVHQSKSFRPLDTSAAPELETVIQFVGQALRACMRQTYEPRLQSNAFIDWSEVPDDVLDDCQQLRKEHEVEALLAREDELLFWRALNVMNTCVLHMYDKFGPRIYELDAEEAGDRFPDLFKYLDQTADHLSLSVALQCSRCLDLPRIERMPTFAADLEPAEFDSTTDTTNEATWLALLKFHRSRIPKIWC